MWCGKMKLKWYGKNYNSTLIYAEKRENDYFLSDCIGWSSAVFVCVIKCKFLVLMWYGGIINGCTCILAVHWCVLFLLMLVFVLAKPITVAAFLLGLWSFLSDWYCNWMVYFVCVQLFLFLYVIIIITVVVIDIIITTTVCLILNTMVTRYPCLYDCHYSFSTCNDDDQLMSFPSVLSVTQPVSK